MNNNSNRQPIYINRKKKCSKCRQVSCKCNHSNPVPTYKRIQIELLQPPGVPPLPPFLFFDMDTRLNEARVREVILVLIGFWNQHYIETSIDGTSDWAACTQEYATRNLTPVWIDKERADLITDGETALEFAMDTLTSFFIQNGTWNAPVAKIDYLNPASGSTMISKNGNKQFHVPLDVSMNPEQLESQANRTLAGSLIHAWMHRMGYRHPEGRYTSYLIGEAPMCLMRGFQDKVPGQPDSEFTQFFD